MRKYKPTYKIIVNRGIPSLRNNQEQEETESLPVIKPKSIAIGSTKNFEIKKVRIKKAITEERQEINLKQGKLHPIQKEESPPLSEIRQYQSLIDQKLKEDNNRSVSTIKKEKQNHSKSEVNENLEDNLDAYVKIYYSIINLMDTMRKNVSDQVEQINRFQEIIDGVHFQALENLIIENSKKFRQILILIKLGIVVIVNSFFDQQVYSANNVNFRNLLIYNLQNYFFLGEFIIQKTQKQELATIIMQNQKHFGSKKVESSIQIRQNVELLQGLYKSISKQSKDLYQFLNSFFRLIPNQKIVESNLMLQNFISLYFTRQQTYHGLLGIPLLSVAHKPYLPNETTHQFTLILDMDETLIHFVDQTKSFLVRPYAEQFLQEMSKYYEIAVFTAGLPDYANWVLDQIIFNKYIQYRLYRQHAMQYQKHFVKDLSRLGRNMAKCIIVDNIAANYQHQEENGIQIKTWYNDSDDKELLKLGVFLRKIAEENCQDVRDALKQYNNVQVY
ncbi:unnamed protein product [Paramecium primaurelia]|uniref:Mitochondrial import inner membrane translocase subunit TIM50 n=1 Tax=Paramecium primaurelia TaxID=5886 RepID=A0A8S1JQH9_PARPR|nr:unnamed protein product [Paramecium primaurelia]